MLNFGDYAVSGQLVGLPSPLRSWGMLFAVHISSESEGPIRRRGTGGVSMIDSRPTALMMLPLPFGHHCHISFCAVV